MAWTFSSPEPKGTLSLKKRAPSRLEVFFLPEDRRPGITRPPAGERRRRPVRILTFDSNDHTLMIEPRQTKSDYPSFLGRKYDKLERIRIAGRRGAIPRDVDAVIDALSNLPSAFTKNPDFGLGLASDYRFIVEAVEELSDCTTLEISPDESTRIDEDESVFYVSESDFHALRRAINSISSLAQTAARSVKWARVYNALAEKVGAPGVEINRGRHPVRQLITAEAMGELVLEEEDQAAAVEVLSQAARAMDRSQTERLIKLQADVELVTLDALIVRFEEMLSRKLAEAQWQAFFNENPFILNMAFGYPVIKVKDQASVGGRRLSGLGEKVTDFLVKNSLTNNTAIFEIKTPQVAVLNKRPYREGVYTPSTGLSGAINQALDQKYQFQKQVTAIKDNSRLYDIESYAVHCCLLVGRTPEGADQKKSFELFRRNSKDVEIVTFDELLQKLRQLREFLGLRE